VKELFSFGKWILVTNVTVFGVSNIDDILVGRYLGVTQLGFYRMAYSLSQAVAEEIMVVTSQVAFPTFVQLQGARDRLRLAYVGTVHFVAFLAFPIAIGTFLVAPDLVPAILGDKWDPIVRPLQWLSIAGLAKGLGGTTSPLFVSQGRPNVPPMFGAARFVLMIASLPYAISTWGIDGAAAVVAITSIITSGTGVVVGMRYAHARWVDVRQSLFYPACNGIAMGAAVVGIQVVLADSGALLQLILSVIVGVVVYFGSVALSSRLFGYQAPKDLVARVRDAVT
jgi:O-antigen/teichoic acid export membrane protein